MRRIVEIWCNEDICASSIFMHLTPKSLIFLIELQVFAVVTSVATPCNKIWVVVNDDKQIEVHEKSDEFVLPTIQQYSLNVSFL